MKIVERLPYFYSYLCSVYPKKDVLLINDPISSKKELLGIIISITPAFNIYIKTTSSLAYRNSLGVVIYSINKEDDPISIDVQAHSPFFTFDSNGHIEEGLILDEVSIKYIFAEELNTIKGHIKEFFTPNSVKFIGSF